MFELLAVTALWQPPKKHMDHQDWENLKCGYNLDCKAAKAKALAPPALQVLACPRFFESF